MPHDTPYNRACQAELVRTHSIWYGPMFSMMYRRAARAEMDGIVQSVIDALRKVRGEEVTNVSVEISFEAGKTFSRRRVFRNTPERAVLLSRLSEEAGVPPEKVAICDRVVDDPDSRDNFTFSTCTKTFLEVRL